MFGLLLEWHSSCLIEQLVFNHNTAVLYSGLIYIQWLHYQAVELLYIIIILIYLVSISIHTD